MKKLLKGIVKFGEQLTDEQRKHFAQLALEQRPDALLIGCSDSRVVPNVFASTDPGDLFVIRNVGNLVPPAESGGDCVAAAIEFSTASLQVTDIIVCGHSGCGAMVAITEGTDSLPKHLRRWLEHGKHSHKKLDGIDPSLPAHDRLSQANVLQQMEHVATYPEIHERIEKGTLQVHGWWFDIADAKVYYYDAAASKFLSVF